MTDPIFKKNKDGWYVCPVCGIRFGKQYVSAGKCPACGFHPPGKKIKSLNDCTKCLREVIKQIELERVIRGNPKEATQCEDANGRGND